MDERKNQNVWPDADREARTNWEGYLSEKLIRYLTSKGAHLLADVSHYARIDACVFCDATPVRSLDIQVYIYREGKFANRIYTECCMCAYCAEDVIEMENDFPDRMNNPRRSVYDQLISGSERKLLDFITTGDHTIFPGYQYYYLHLKGSTHAGLCIVCDSKSRGISISFPVEGSSMHLSGGRVNVCPSCMSLAASYSKFSLQQILDKKYPHTASCQRAGCKKSYLLDSVEVSYRLRNPARFQCPACAYESVVEVSPTHVFYMSSDSAVDDWSRYLDFSCYGCEFLHMVDRSIHKTDNLRAHYKGGKLMCVDCASYGAVTTKVKLRDNLWALVYTRGLRQYLGVMRASNNRPPLETKSFHGKLEDFVYQLYLDEK